MARRVILALGLAVVAPQAAAESAPEKSPINILNDEIADAKHFMEPLQGLMSGISKGLAAAANEKKAAPKKPAAAAELSLQSQATNKVKQPAVPKAAAPAPEIKPKAKVEAEAEVAVSAKEHRRLWTVLLQQTPMELVLLSKLFNADRLGPKLEEWCKDEESPASCQFENAGKKYCELIGHAATYLVDRDALSDVMVGFLENEAAGLEKKAAGLEKKAGSLLLQQSAGDEGTFGEIARSAALAAKVESMCGGLNAHPGCHVVAKELATCQAVGKATASLVGDTDRIADALLHAFNSHTNLQAKRVVPQ